MSRLICPFKDKNYSFNKYKVKRKYKNETRYFDIFFKSEYIGFFDTRDSLTTHNGGREIYFLISENEKPNQTSTLGQNKIGTIAFSCMNEEFVWKIKYIKLKSLPKIFISPRKVLIEKCTH
jgi:hypothetical protein